MTAPTDAEVIARARVEPAAFAAIFDRHHEAIHAYLRRRLDAAIAEELAAETFARALHGVARYNHGRADALPWLYGIAANLARRHRRTELRRLRAYARTGHDPLADEQSDAPARLDAAPAHCRDPQRAPGGGAPRRGLSAPVGTAIEDVVYTKRAVTNSAARP